MKKLIATFLLAVTAMFGIAGTASAQYGTGGGGTVSDTTPGPGGSVIATFKCVTGETVTFYFPGATVAGVRQCLSGTGNTQTKDGTASITLTAPTTPGTYTASATGSVSGDLGSVAIVVAPQVAPTTVAPTPTPTVPGTGLPATGSDGIGTTTGIAIGLLVVGLGLFVVATVRRRGSAVAA